MIAILEQLGLDVISCDQITRSRILQKQSYVVNAAQGKFFLKLFAPRWRPSRSRALIRSLFGNPALRRQLLVYKNLERGGFQSLHYPKLVSTDSEHYLLLEFIEQAADEVRVRYMAGDAFRQELVSSLLEFQTSRLLLQQKATDRALITITIAPSWLLVRRSLTKLRKRCGLVAALRCMRVIAACHRAQRRLKTPVVLHNDFHPNNIMIGSDRRLYIADLESVTEEHRWVLIDIAHYAVATERFSIDLDLLTSYIRKAQSRLEALDVAAQLRIALLRRVTQHIISGVPPEPVKQRYEDFLLNVLLPDRAYREWYEKNVKPDIEPVPSPPGSPAR